MTIARESPKADAARAEAANTLLMVDLRGLVRAVNVDDENRIDAARQMVSPARARMAPRVAPASLEALLQGGARFAMLRAPDRRPHPACARGLLARIDARVRAAGLRARVGPCDDEHGAWFEALAHADAQLRREDRFVDVRVELCEDVEEVRHAAAMPAAANAGFAEALRAQLPALEALCRAPVELVTHGADTLRVRVAAPHVAPHVVLAAVLAAGTAPGGAETLDASVSVATLLGSPIEAQLSADAP
jgi:hypothetical protein